ncbi:DNA-binding helix-turn-helix protein [Leptospira ryugenii]|uniref:DNA-binding helix-turn-helix protein n=1 Tax=Leptospira ryugenii TaxID=1917863 RepID=A0A2P2E136_9LEPT|nr:helix-turn-helix domain-containing protein [Leptospira ryugenii]GBF50601.1 DNA-binding helix-turn-helix protein [Leptospira ryugenii]
MESFHIARTFIGFTSGLAFLLAISEWLSKEKNPRMYLQASLFSLVAIFQFHSYYVTQKLYTYFPHFYLVHLPFTAFFGSLLYRFFSAFWKETTDIPRFHVWEFLPSVFVLFLLYPIFSESGDEKLRLIQVYGQSLIPGRIKLAITVAVLPVCLSAFLALYQVVHPLRWQSIQTSPDIRMVLLILCMGSSSAFVGLYLLYFRWIHGLEIVSSILGVLLILIHLLRHRNPELLREVSKIVVADKKYQSSQLKTIDVQKLGETLEKRMKEDKLYKNDELSLGDLASALGITQHQLSEYLNQHQKKNFFQFVNAYRIEEAKLLCKNEKEKTILSIAYEVGFPSKSTFYDAFKRETGMSPTEYRKK